MSVAIPTILLVLFLAVPAVGRAQTARDVVQTAERAVSDDSADVVRARWTGSLARDSSDRAAALGLGSLARLVYDFPAADRLFRHILRHDTGTDQWTIQARIGLYRVALGEGNWLRADSLLTIAIADARRIGDRGGEIDAMIGFSNTRSALGGMEASFAALDSLEPLLAPGDSWERAQSLCRRGLYRAVVSHADAPTVTGQGIAMAERLGERRITGHCLEAHALTLSMLGRRDSVLGLMDRAEALLRATHDHSSLGRLASRRSDELQFLGRLGEAKAALRQVLEEAEISKNRERYGFAYGGLGMLALRVNDLPTAVEYFERAAALYDSLGQLNGARIARSNRAWVLSMGDDLAAARTAFDTVLTESLETGRLEDEFIARQQLARLDMRQGDWAGAATQLDTAERSARAHGRGAEARADLVYDRARVALGRGDLAAAERMFTAFLQGIEPDRHLHRHLTQMRLAEVWARRGDLARAERQMTDAGREMETWRASLGDDDLRRFAFAATALGEHEPQAPVARVLAALARAGRTDLAFTLSEQRRARTLTDRLNQADVLREEGVAAGTRAHRVRPVTAAELAAALPDGTALLEYMAGSEDAPTTLFVVTRAGARAHLLPSADSLAAPVRRLVALLEDGAAPEAIARSLGATLFGPAVESLPPEVTRLVIVPDGPLHRVPFDVLRLSDGRAAVERWAVGQAPSAGVVLALWNDRKAVPATGPVRMLALGDPEFAGERIALASRGAETYRSAFDAEGGLARLAGSGQEARIVARFAPGGAEVRLRDDASEGWLKQARLDGFRVIHLATHALVDETSLARTALALAPSAGEDGFLSPADLARLRLAADLVVLSACRTAGGVAIAGEGMEGLTAPLVAAGARAVVATQWRIGDRSTVRLVGDFYSALARGLPVADALQAAKLAAMRRGAPAGEWAGFTVAGDPLARVAVTEPAPTAPRRWVVAAALLLLAAAAVAYLAVRRRGRNPDRGPGRGVIATTHQR
jgi:tetratricopeptide (TPR) repeat protein